MKYVMQFVPAPGIYMHVKIGAVALTYTPEDKLMLLMATISPMPVTFHLKYGPGRKFELKIF